jgi:BirA family biotin operon repressor/biotin-[acetyl-CoA-carboxylase] ligase
VVIGIGINVTTPIEAFPVELRSSATSLLAATGRSPERLALLKAVLLELDSAYAALRREGPGTVLGAWKAYGATLGRRVRLEMTDGTVEGEAVGLTDRGHLVVRTDEGLDVPVIAGEVVHLRGGPPG